MPRKRLFSFFGNRMIQAIRPAFAGTFLGVAFLSACGAPPEVLQTLAGENSSAPQGLNSQLYSCYARDVFDLCVPSIGKGQRVILRSRGFSQADLEKVLATRSLKAVSQPVLKPLREADGEAEKALIAESSGAPLYDMADFLPPLASRMFNKSAGFSGPNCYHTALVASGLLNGSRPRHVAKQEFDTYLSAYFDKVPQPQAGDIIVYDASRSRDHVAFYLFDDLIYHKKGYKRGYRYRVTEMHRAFEAEAFEWHPQDEFPNTDNAELQAKDRAYYRRRPTSATPAPTSAEQAMITIIDFFTNTTAEYAPNSKVGDVMGTISEPLIQDLNSLFEPLKSSPSLEARLAYGRLVSTKDQFFESIDETLYASPFAEPSRINLHFCYQENTYLTEMVAKISGYLLGRTPTNTEVTSIIETKVKTLKRETCRLKVKDLVP
jgi:hypothetical protein